MSFINKRKTSKNHKDAHLNWMGAPSFDINDPLLRLRLAASSCFFGEPMYYQRDTQDKRRVRHNPRWRLRDAEVAYLRDALHALDPQEWRGMSPAELMESVIDVALDADPKATLLEAIYLRNDALIRTTPQVILVRAANHPNVRGTGLVRKFAPDIIKRADEPSVGLAYQLWRYGKPVPNALKKAWRDALERFSEYELAKYRMENRQVKTVDVANLVHPKSEAVNKLVNGTLRVTGRTWEGIISTKGSSKATWLEALDVMGHMALLRNLRNLLEAEIAPQHYIEKLVKGAEKGKQLPFRYYSAYRAIEQPAPPVLLDAVEECLMLSIGNLPQFNGRVMSLSDNSGSARGTATSSMGTMQIATIGNLTGILTAMQADEGHLGVFGDRLDSFAVRKRSSVFDMLQKAEQLGNSVGGGTENGIWLFWDKAIREQEHWDHVFVYSDMQAGHGGLYGVNAPDYAEFQWNKRYIDVPKLIRAYREQVNPQVMVYLVQIAGYRDTIVPEFYDRTFMLGGWSAGILRFAADMTALYGQQSQ